MAPMDPQSFSLNDDVYHGSTICPPRLLRLPWLHTLSHSMMMDHMYPHSVPLIYYGSYGSLQYVPPQL